MHEGGVEEGMGVGGGGAGKREENGSVKLGVTPGESQVKNGAVVIISFSW